MRAWAIGAMVGMAVAGGGAGAAAAQDDWFDQLALIRFAPGERPASWSSEDAEAGRLIHGLTGVFRTTANQEPALEFRSAPVPVEGLQNTVYFEVVRQDSPWAPFRQGVIQVFRQKGTLVLRLFDITGALGLRESLVGLWAAPDVFPKLSLESLSPNLDLPVRIGTGLEKDITASTAHAFPTTRGGAVEMTSTMQLLNHDSLLVFADRGFDSEGKQVWGPGPKEEIRFTRIQEGGPGPVVNRLDGGLVTIDLVSGEAGAPKLESGGSVVVQYSFWLTDGTLIDSSRRAGREPMKTQSPGTRIKGFDTGLLGISKGTRRRIIVPPELGFGKSGALREVPPDSTLVFDVECLWLENPAQPPPQTPPPSAPGKAGPAAAPGAKPVAPPGSAASSSTR